MAKARLTIKKKETPVFPSTIEGTTTIVLSTDTNVLLTDASGKLWRVDSYSGMMRPVRVE